MRDKRFFLFVTLVFLLASGLIAGCGGDDDGGGDSSTGNISGTVTNTEGNPVEGATCSITTTETDSKPVYTDTTDGDGLFLINGVPGGTWTLTINASGYQSLTLTTTINPGNTTEVPESETQVQPSGNGTVTGTVTNSGNSAAVEGAVITVTNAPNTGTSAADGTYTIENITAGVQTVTATKDGFKDYSSSVTVTANSAVTHNIAMTPDEIPTPDPGKGHITGKVQDESGNGISGVTCTVVEKGKATITAQTDSQGQYTLLNVTEGSQTVNMAKTGYDNAQVQSTVVDGQTVTAGTVTMRQEVSSGTTLLCSIPRTTEDAAKGAMNPTVSDDGSLVAFEADQPLLAIHNSANAHIYYFRRSSGVVTMVDKNTDGNEGNDNSTAAMISGDGSRVVFVSDATDLLGQGADSNDAGDIFLYDIPTGKVTRISTSFNNKNIGGNFDSQMPSISRDGTYVAFSSMADNLCNPGLYVDTNSPDTINIYRATIGDDGTTTSMMMISQRQRGGECDPNDWQDGGGNPMQRNSFFPYISSNGRYVVYLSDAQKGIFWATAGHGAGDDDKTLVQTPAQGRDLMQIDLDVFLCDTEKSVSTMTTLVSIDAEGKTQPDFIGGGFMCMLPTVSDDGKYVAFTCMDGGNTWMAQSDFITDVWLKNTTTGELTRVSACSSGIRDESQFIRVSRDGTLCSFDSSSTGFVQNDTNNSSDCFVYDIENRTYTRVNLTSNNEQAEDTVTGGGNGSMNVTLSGNNNYVVFESDAKNLVQNEYFVPGAYDVYLRKWR